MADDIKIEDIIKLFKTADSSAQKDFISDCPFFTLRDTAANLLSAENPQNALLVLDMLSAEYGKGTACALGAKLAKACYTMAADAYNNSTAKDKQFYINAIGNSANNLATALLNLGQAGELINFLKDAIPLVEKINYTINPNSLYLIQIEAYLNLKDPDKAEELLIKFNTKTNLTPSHVFYKDRLKKLIAQMKGSVTDIHNKERNIGEEGRQTISQFMDVFEQIQPGMGSIIKSLKDKLEKQQPQTEKQALNNLNEFLNQATKIVSDGKELNEFEIMQKLRDATSVFHDPSRSHNPDMLNESLKTLEIVRSWSHANNFPQHENDALWSQHICYKRTGKKSEAIKVLQALRSNMEEARSKIADPFERAGVVAKYPFLYACLCELLCELNRPEELLNAIEGAKGRLLADVLLKQDAKPVHESKLSEDSALVPALMKKLKAHYLSYFVDDERTYPVLVTKTGALYTQNIPLGKNNLKNWYSEIIPKYWGKKDASLQTIPDNLPYRLSPFISWLEPFAEQGIIEKGDHICYAPDDYLYLIPFHYLIFLNQPFVHYVSLSRIHGAKTLAALLERETALYDNFTAVQVPAQQDRNNPEKLRSFTRASAWLKQNISGQVLENEAADVETVIKCELKNKLIHFATHGYFPHEDSQKKKMNPYQNSGLVLAAEGRLPDLERIAREEDQDTMLTPEKIIGNKINLENSHITLQACVTGLAREGLAGDALGLEWGFLLAKASSLLVTHWNVEAEVSADFCISFYHKWLKENKPRARAWRETVLEFMQKKWDPGQHAAFYWAPFSLTGDWR